MAIKASGSISFSDIANEFGTPPNRNLGAYRVSQTVGELSNLPLDTGIPQSGIVSFSTFYSKKLNVVVNCGSGSRINARTLYNDATVGIISAIGGYRIRPASSSGSKVWIHVSGTIESNSAASQFYCSLLTGDWDGNTDLILDIGPSGFVRGIGGNGGAGGPAGGSDGSPGTTGTSAIGITSTPISIRNRGTVLAGTGGGGGGGGGVRGTSAPLYVRGGGGGGGAPYGLGAPKGAGAGGLGLISEDGQPAGLFNQGPGGSGGYASGPSPTGTFREIYGGPGGPGGSSGGNAFAPGFSPGPSSAASLGYGAPAGPSGFAFVISGSSANVTTSGPVSAIYNTNPS